MKPKLKLVTDERRLQTKCAHVRDFQVFGLLPSIRMMAQLCLEEDGAAIAAPQVGIPLRFFVAFSREQDDIDFDVLFNPGFKPLKKHGRQTAAEGCLSYPGRFFEVPRWKKIKLSWQHYNHETRKFRRMEKTVDGFLARMVQHEIDHLNGVLIPKIGREVDANGLISEVAVTQHEVDEDDTGPN